MLQKIKNVSLSKIQIWGILGIYVFLFNGLVFDFAPAWVVLAWLILLLPFVFLHRWIFKTLIALQIIITSLALFAKSRYQVLISEDILLSALLSESDLTAEMLSVRWIMWVLLTAILPIILLIFIKIKSENTRKQMVQAACILILGLGIVGLILGLGDYSFRDKGQIRDSRFMSDVLRFSPVDAQYNAHRAYKTWRNMQKNYLNVADLTQKYQYKSEVDDLLLVFVQGESTRGDHWALNGYAQPTNPRLSQIKNVYSFQGVSCDTLTVNSLNCLSSPMLKTDEGRQVKQSSFGQILKFLGYRTEIYSLQTLSAFYAYLGYDKLVSKYQITANQTDGAKDTVLLPHVLQAIRDYRGGKQMIYAHTLGSHQTYADRIDPKYAPFQPYCHNPDVAKCSKNELNQAYDNTVVNVDAFLADTITALQNKKALLIYVSDHGESLGEGGYYFHGQPVKTAPKEQFSVPVVFWFSDSYRATEQGKRLAQKVEKALQNHEIVSHDHIFHSVLGCAGVVSANGGIDKALNICEK